MQQVPVWITNTFVNCETMFPAKHSNSDLPLNDVTVNVEIKGK